ncbi:MAG: hypothetical protein A3H35_17945 [Betaproteobacteria bacterium RIFCSPLOWO2_02_FULL_62_17]|nr:MAG: hypothetical protein A3H35_17945 [Betaproteobacteria bacterium RIFCSPLOWO2_02_FULL_62_17]
MITGWPMLAVSRVPSARASRSESPPAGNGASRRIGFSGYCWACAGIAASIAAARIASLEVNSRTDLIRNFPLPGQASRHLGNGPG